MSATRKPLPARHEAFCRHIADGCSQAEAARRAGYPPVAAKQRGSELFSRSEIQERVGQITAERADEAAALKVRTIERLDVIHDKAMEAGRLSLALRALLAVARIGGVLGPAAQPSRPHPVTDEAGTGGVGTERASRLPPELDAALDALLGPSSSPLPSTAGALARGDLRLPPARVPSATVRAAAAGR